jgi:signal transduction histidine kinase
MNRQKRGRILIVDDDFGMREFLSLTLTEAGYAVLLAANGLEALRRFERHLSHKGLDGGIDLTLMDIKLPRPGGIDLLRQFREKDPDAVVILITGYASLETAMQAVRYGAYDYLTKPLPEVNELLSIVERGLEQRRLKVNNRKLLTQLRKAYEENLRLLEEMQDRIAERTRELEEANRQLKGLDRLKSELLANISHELYTPLNAIIGFSQALLDGLHGPLSEAQARLVKSVQSSGHRLKRSFDDLIDMARLTADEVTVRPKAVLLKPLLEDMKALVEQSAQQKQIKVRMETAPGTTVAWSDEVKLKRMLYELLSNAVRFTPEEGQITLRASVHPPDEPNEMRLAVSDTGIGIPANELSAIFDPFRQLDTSLSRRHGGLGLGLAVVHHYAKLHGGRVWAESEPGVGSTFTLALPLPPDLNE